MLVAPFKSINITVPEHWIDVNEHMNATHYGLVVYDAHYAFTQELGLGAEYVKTTGCSKVVVESHLVYEREACLGDELEVISWLLAVDHKRMHFVHELYNRSRDCRAAIAEQVDMHVDLTLRRSTPFASGIYEQLQKRVQEYLALPMPRGVGSQIRPPKNNWRAVYS